SSKGLSPKETLKIYQKDNTSILKDFWPIVIKLANIDQIEPVTTTATTTLLVRTTEYAVVLEGKIDTAQEREALLKDIEYQKGFMASVDKKLSNEKFVTSAKP